jgi:mannose-1-phosphate guanylyltransferase/mannose-6-phosphate isomerase
MSDSSSLTVVIMCGGNGTRLWPLSRVLLPKQFLKLTDKKYTMFQLSLLTAQNLNPDNYIVVCNSKHQFLAKEQLEELSISNYKIIAEPFGKNTAAAIASACQVTSNNSNMLVMTADHMWDHRCFKNAVHSGLELIDNTSNNQSSIVVFGTQPTYPETGYGYINYENNNLIKFVEKPNKDIAESYLEKGNYLWNSGNFLFKRSTMRQNFMEHAKDIWKSVLFTVQLSDERDKVLTLDSEQFNKVRDESIDYAVMEFHQGGKVVPYSGYWSDIGSFKSLHSHLPKDNDGNYLEGDVMSVDTKNCLVKSEGRLITTLGVEDLVIIDTRDTLFVAHRERSQDVKQFVKKLKLENRSEPYCHAKVYRPWGWYINVEGTDTSGFKVKRIGVYPGKRLSLQSHKRRSEHWVIAKGKAKVRVGDDELILHVNQHVYIPKGSLHRMENIGEELVEFVETQIGDYLGEDDIERFEDDFGRV